LLFGLSEKHMKTLGSDCQQECRKEVPMVLPNIDLSYFY